MTKVTRLTCIVVILLCGMFALLGADYSIIDFHSDITITPKGVYQIKEDFTLNFDSPRHGLYRVLPRIYRFEDPLVDAIYARITHVRSNENLSINHQGDYTILQLGRSDTLVRGEKRYTLSYNYDFGEDSHIGYDEIYFNIVGEMWEVPLRHVSFTIHLPFSIDETQLSLFRGQWGSTSNQDVRWVYDESSLTLKGEGSNFLPGEALTIALILKEGYFEKRFDYQRALGIPALLICMGTIALAFYLWRRYGKDDDLIVVPQFVPPKGMTPLDVGYVIDGSLDAHDITAMIFYWADKGSLTIVEDKKGFSFVRGKDPTHPLSHEKRMYDDFFASSRGGVVTLKELEKSFAPSFQKLKGALKKYYKGERALKDSVSQKKAALSLLLLALNAALFSLVNTINYPGAETVIFWFLSFIVALPMVGLWWSWEKAAHLKQRVKSFFIFLGVIAIAAVGSTLLVGLGLEFRSDIDLLIYSIVVLMISHVSISFLSAITNKRSAYAHTILEQILGLKDFIERVEIDQLKVMIEDNPLFYYQTLSYAIALNIEHKWAKKFSSITIEKPQWYIGTNDLVNAMIIHSFVTRLGSSVGSTVKIQPKSSPSSRFGGSSFGGGGFSGGGFGGGGGGAW
ncbi:MAG: DUF2207 domain-containing protein [Sphaerochaetaceae bacterium]